MLLMFTKPTDFHAIRSRQTAHGFSIASRSVLVDFSLGPRSSLVRLSLLSRQSIEDRTRTERGTSKKTNERATNVDRENSEKLSKTRRNATVMADSTPFCNHKPAKCLLPQICRGGTLLFQSTLSISMANNTISPIPWTTMIQPCKNHSTGF